MIPINDLANAIQETPASTTKLTPAPDERDKLRISTKLFGEQTNVQVLRPPEEGHAEIREGMVGFYARLIVEPCGENLSGFLEMLDPPALQFSKECKGLSDQNNAPKGRRLLLQGRIELLRRLSRPTQKRGKAL